MELLGQQGRAEFDDALDVARAPGEEGDPGEPGRPAVARTALRVAWEGPLAAVHSLALISREIGGEVMHRDHCGYPAGRDPFVPVKAAKQREALKFLQEHILTDRPFQFPPQLLRRLAVL